MPTIKSTYNFVPAPEEKEVLKPSWSQQVSHDIPFSDGESGEIELTITAKTPIFIRNGHAQGAQETEFSHRVVNGKKEYFIPGTSMKGMVRNVLEIMSKGRMKQVSDDRYSFRDLTRNSLYMRSYKSGDVECGWLYEDKEGNWLVEDCERPIRISHKIIDPLLGTNFRNQFLMGSPKEKTAAYKYQQVKKSLDYPFKTIRQEHKTVAFPDNEGKVGTIVFTGQSSRRNEPEDRRPSGKLYEFVFFRPDTPKPPIEITPKQQKDFKFIYLDHDANNISKDWKFRREQLEKGEKIPVFFNRATGNTVKHFGLAFMYKLPYEHSIHETLPYKTYNIDEGKDLVETIFGTTEDEVGKLKGRVMVGHAFSNNAIPEQRLIKEILASPKASYFPFYIEQPNPNRRYQTYMDENAVLRGFKRYPVHKTVKSGQYSDLQKNNSKVFSAFLPLKAGARFLCKIRFHNLRKIEIGALLSALSFHSQGDKFFHTLGGAKPFGYGKVSIQIAKLNFLNHEQDDYLSAFEEQMNEHQADWLNSASFKELLAMATESNTDDHLVYPMLAIPGAQRRDANEFINYKGGFALSKHSEENGLPNTSSIIGKKQVAEKIKQGGFIIATNNFKAIKAQFKEAGITDVPEELISSLEKAIKEVFENDRPSKSKLSKKDFSREYEWHTTITNWIGRERAQALYKKLTGHEPI